MENNENKELSYKQLIDSNHTYAVPQKLYHMDFSELEKDIKKFYEQLDHAAQPVISLTNFMDNSNICNSEVYNIISSYKLQRLFEIGKEKGDLVKIVDVQEYANREYGRLPEHRGRAQAYFVKESRLLVDPKAISFEKDSRLKFTSELIEEEFYARVNNEAQAIQIAEKEPTKFNRKKNELAICVREGCNDYSVDFERNLGTSSKSFGVSQYSRHVSLAEFYIECNLKNNNLFDLYDTYKAPFSNDSRKSLISSLTLDEAKSTAKELAMNVADYVSKKIGIAQYYVANN
ncbi:MAG: hypothetical protein ACP5N1_01130 [Candidatus Woesearchaeota archaeon]